MVRSMRPAVTKGRAASWTRTTSVSAVTASNPLATESCRRSPPATMRIGSTDCGSRAGKKCNDVCSAGSTRMTSEMREWPANALTLCCSIEPPPMSRSCLGFDAPSRRPAPGAAMMAVTCMSDPSIIVVRMRTTAAVLCTLSLSTSALAQNVVRYEPKESDLKYVFGKATPVATVKPGDIIDTKTFDCFGNVIQKPGDTLAQVPGDNPLTGPFYVEGTEPGDTLVVKILQLDVDSNQGVGALAPGFGALNTTNYTPMLHA